MSVVSNIKRAFGFSVVDEDEDYDSVMTPGEENLAVSGIVNPFRRAPQPRSVETAVEHPELPEGQPDIPYHDNKLPGQIFDSVIKLFNRTMPDFVKRCLDTDSQRQYIFNSIDSAVRNHLDCVCEEARRYGLRCREEEHSRLAEEVGRLTGATVGLEEERREATRVRASLERRASALEKRVNDLEEMLMEAQEQNEKLTHRVQSLQRRLRKSRTRPDDTDGQMSLFEEESAE